MHELAAILAAADRLAQSPDESVLVTLVKAEGSTYRRPGARMLILPGCRTIGTISGGCLEAAVARKAWQATRNATRALLQIDSAPEDDNWGPASGCHGRLFLLAEPIPPCQRLPALELLAQSRTADHPALIIHEFHLHPDQTLTPAATHIAHWSPAAPPAIGHWSSEIGHWSLDPSPIGHWSLDIGHSRAAFLELIPPHPHLLICGAGDDARPVAQIAATLGWRIDILDSRARLATAERFPAAQHISSAGPAALKSQISNPNALALKSQISNFKSPPLVHPHTAAIIMSHRFADDLEYLAHLLTCNLPYIGLLGPRARANRLLEELSSRNQSPTAQQLANLHNPIGLDIGAREPELIALAILAEIQATLATRDGRSLTQQVGNFHVPQPDIPRK